MCHCRAWRVLGVLLSAWVALCPLCVVLGGGGHPPPPVTAEDLAKASKVLADPESSTRAKLDAIELIWHRPTYGKETTTERLRILKSAAQDPRHGIAVRLHATVGWRMADDEDPALQPLIRQLILKALQSRDPLDLKVAAADFGWHGYDPKQNDESRRIALTALRHYDPRVRRAGLSALRHCGQAEDASFVRPVLGDPLHDDFLIALEVASKNESIAAEVRVELMRICQSEAMAKEPRLTALLAVPAPWDEPHLRAAGHLVRTFTLRPDEVGPAIIYRAAPEQAAPFLIALAKTMDPSYRRPLEAMQRTPEQCVMWSIQNALRYRGNEQERRQAMAFLGHPKVMQWVVQCALDETFDERTCAHNLLTSYGNLCGAVPLLNDALKRSEPMARQLAAQMLGSMQCDSPLPLANLKLLLDDPDPGVRKWAAYAIRCIEAHLLHVKGQSKKTEK